MIDLKSEFKTCNNPGIYNYYGYIPIQQKIRNEELLVFKDCVFNPVYVNNIILTFHGEVFF